jgi:hypothetical protein
MTTTLFSQAPVSASCKYKHLTYYAEKGEGLPQIGMAYTRCLVKDSLRQRIDTVAEYGNFFNNQLCLCTDTSVVFYDTNDLGHPKIRHYYFNGHKWNITFPSLPEGDLTFIGMITPGEKYKSYKHRLITPEKAVSEMTIQIGANNDENNALAEVLNLIGSYEVEFLLSPDKKNFVVSKETLKKE